MFRAQVSKMALQRVGASMEMRMRSKIFPSLLSGQLPAKAFRGETVRRYVSLSWSSAAVFVEQEEGEGVGSGSAQGRAKATQGYPSPQIARHP